MYAVHQGVGPIHSFLHEIKFAAAPANLTHEGHISSTSSEPLSLSIHVGPDAVQAFSTYYQKLGHRVNLNLHVKPDPSEPWEHNFMTDRWEQETGWMDETDFDWVPWSSPIQARRRYLTGNVGLSSIPMQKQRPVQAMPVHYLSNEARQPAFIDVSDIADLRSMTIEERDLLAPIAQPSIKVFESGRVPSFYFDNMGQPGNPWLNNAMGQYIYVGDTWLNKVLPVAAEVEGQHVRDMGGLLDVQ
ncbi:hypothetical protein EDB19DRAFT_1778147 [Suillus lakei]|nr:hypothetical protein EDB19DRAFT_1778147 [Suillus lakei]